jgi:spore maturation protein CgeB
VFAGDGVWEGDYARVINAAKIGLGLLSKRYPETTTTRTFEIPGCGTFLLAERSLHHQELYKEGREAEFFGNADEMVEKINYYLANPAQRLKIAAAGHQRCIASGYSNRHRVRKMLDYIENLHGCTQQSFA